MDLCFVCKDCFKNSIYSFNRLFSSYKNFMVLTIATSGRSAVGSGGSKFKCFIWRIIVSICVRLSETLLYVFDDNIIGQQ